MYLALLLILPFLLCLLAKYIWKDYGIAQFLITVAICLVIAGAGLGIEFYGVTTDTEVWSGNIIDKKRERVSCRHSYPCNPHSCNCDSKGNCSTCWDTCYDHSYDIDWNLYFSTGKRTRIDAVDRQGLVEPKRWDAAYLGEPTAETHTFTNYLLAAPDNVLLRYESPKGFEKVIPAYPSGIHDYYRCNRFLLGGAVPVKGENDWRWLLDKLNADLGSAKQVNIIVILAATADPRYEFALQKAWVGGKKNDLVVCIGVTKYPAIDWVRIISWTTDASVKVLLRDDIMAIGTLDKRDDIMGAIRKEVTVHFQRRHMKDLKYLVASHQPSGTAMVVILFLECIAVFGVAYTSHEMRQGRYYSY
jgi:hypothetical protein